MRRVRGGAARAAGGFYSTRTQPPLVGGEGLDRIDIVTHCDGLDEFDVEYARTSALRIDDFEIRVLELRRIIASKEAADRPKDRAVLEQLRAALAAIDADVSHQKGIIKGPPPQENLAAPASVSTLTTAHHPSSTLAANETQPAASRLSSRC